MVFLNHPEKELHDLQGYLIMTSTPVSSDDSPSFVMALIGFCIPLVGLILYFVQRDKTPLRARSAGRGAAWGFGLGIVTTILFVIMAILGPVFSRARSNAEKQRTSVQ